VTTVTQYAAMSEDELLEALGSILLGDGLGAGGIDPREAFRAGSKWIADRAERLRASVCGSQTFAQINGNAADDIAIVAAAILAHDAGWAAVGAPVAAVLVRRGLQTFCSV
jgi:hypothetical protein